MTTALSLITQNRDLVKEYEIAKSCANKSYLCAALVPFALFLTAIVVPVAVYLFLPTYFISSIVGSALVGIIVNYYLYATFFEPSRTYRYDLYVEAQKLKESFEIQDSTLGIKERTLTAILQVKKKRLELSRESLSLVFETSDNEEGKTEFLELLPDPIHPRILEKSKSCSLYKILIEEQATLQKKNERQIVSALLHKCVITLRSYAKLLCKVGYYQHILNHPDEMDTLSSRIVFPEPFTVDREVVAMVNGEPLVGEQTLKYKVEDLPKLLFSDRYTE